MRKVKNRLTRKKQLVTQKKTQKRINISIHTERHPLDAMKRSLAVANKALATRRQALIRAYARKGRNYLEEEKIWVERMRNDKAEREKLSRGYPKTLSTFEAMKEGVVTEQMKKKGYVKLSCVCGNFLIVKGPAKLYKCGGCERIYDKPEKTEGVGSKIKELIKGKGI